MSFRKQLWIMQILAIIFLAAGAGAVPVEEWNRTESGMGWGISDIAPTVDGGYILAAYDCIAKIDASGNRQWIRELNNPETASSGYSTISLVDQTDDGGYIIGGRTNMYRTTGMDAILIKVYSSGNELWNMTAGGDGNQVVNTMLQTSDGGLIFAGSIRNPNSERKPGGVTHENGKE
jgi:hypothetical protein